MAHFAPEYGQFFVYPGGSLCSGISSSLCSGILTLMASSTTSVLKAALCLRLVFFTMECNLSFLKLLSKYGLPLQAYVDTFYPPFVFGQKGFQGFKVVAI